MPKAQPQSAGSGRSARGRRVATTLAEINVVPLVDVMLVLLIIFMVTAPLMQRGVDVNLPVSARATAIVGERTYVTVPGSYRQTKSVYLNEEPIRLEALQERVRQRMASLPDKQVYLRGDVTVQLQELMEVFDRLRAAGIEKIGIVARRGRCPQAMTSGRVTGVVND